MSSGRAPTDAGVTELAERIRSGEWSAQSVIDACLTRIETLDRDLLAWAFIDADGAQAAARDLDRDLAGGRPLGPLHGIPIGIKDIIDVARMPTTAGAAAFAHTRPTRDATLVARLRATGAIIVGKTQATEFAYRDPAPTRNPWSADRTPGGSSSGSAAAVAARMVPGAIGTQTVGSILRPAAYCGVVGFKGDLGAVPLDGVVPLSRPLDHVGPIARSVGDVALLDAILRDEPVSMARIGPPRLGVLRETFERAEPGLRRHLVALLARLAEAGADVVEVEVPTAFAPLAEAGQVLLEAGAAATHATMFAEHADEYGPTIHDLVLAGRSRSPAEVEHAERIRGAAREAFERVTDAFDAMVSPVAPSTAPPFDDGTGDGSLCAPWSTLGVPAISIPTGLDPEGLPFAVQLVGGAGRSSRLLQAAAWCERIIAFEDRPPG